MGGDGREWRGNGSGGGVVCVERRWRIECEGRGGLDRPIGLWEVTIWMTGCV